MMDRKKYDGKIWVFKNLDHDHFISCPFFWDKISMVDDDERDLEILTIDHDDGKPS